MKLRNRRAAPFVLLNFRIFWLMLATQLKWKRPFFRKVIHLILKKFRSSRTSGQTHFNALSCNIVDKHEGPWRRLCVLYHDQISAELTSKKSTREPGRCEHTGVLTFALTRRCGSLPHGAGLHGYWPLEIWDFLVFVHRKKCIFVQKCKCICLFDVAVWCLPHCIYSNVFNAILLSAVFVVYPFLKTSWLCWIIRPLG